MLRRAVQEAAAAWALNESTAARGVRELDLVHAGHCVDYLRQVCAEGIFLRFNERGGERRGRGGGGVWRSGDLG